MRQRWAAPLLAATAVLACSGAKSAGGSHGASGTGGSANDAPTNSGGGMVSGTSNANASDALGGSSTGGAVNPDSGGTASSSSLGGAGGTLPTTSDATGGTLPAASDPLGAHPFDDSFVTLGGTMTFTNVGATGWWPRRLDRDAGDPACDYKDGTDTWGAHCCMTEHETQSAALSPFDEEMTLILKAIDIKQLAVYQPSAETRDASWQRITAWDDRGRSDNLWFTQQGDGSPEFPGALTHDDCVGYLTQAPLSDCEGGAYYCPDDPGVLHRGFRGSKLVVFLGSMSFDDSGVSACGSDEPGHPGPWVAFVASELVRDGGRKWNGACNCYSKTDSVGDGCGEINVFEVVMDNNDYSNREFASTGVRSFQAGHVGGAVCGAGCSRDDVPPEAEVVDACAGTAYSKGPVLEMGGATDGCPVWRRPDGDRYFFILLDATEHMIQVGVIHPANIPDGAADLLPTLPALLERSSVDALLAMRLPS